MKNLTRRRFISIAAAAGLTSTTAQASSVARWRGAALGARAEIFLTGLTEQDARPIFASIETELERLERIFSLYQPESAIVRLNRDGYLAEPPAELLQLCSLVSVLHRNSKGAFDPTVQPLWNYLASVVVTGGTPDPNRIGEALDLVDWTKLEVNSSRISFARPGMAITLNGVAQGYITDRIAAKLRSVGLTDVLVDVGEIVASGKAADGKPWQVGIAPHDDTDVVARITLSDRALATSAPLGTVLDPAGKLGHIINPKAGLVSSKLRQVSVSATSASVADGLSTAICAAGPACAEEVLAGFPDARIESMVV